MHSFQVGIPKFKFLDRPYPINYADVKKNKKDYYEKYAEDGTIDESVITKLMEPKTVDA